MHGWNSGVGWFGMVAAVIASVIVLGGLAAVTVIVLRTVVDRPHGRPPTVDPRAVLDERFARGEIDVDDYRARRDALGD